MGHRTVNDFDSELKQRLDGFKMPKAVILVGELPKTSTGKIQKNVVRSEHSKYYEEG